MDSFTIVLFAVLVITFAAGFFFLVQRIGELSSLLKGDEILQRLELHRGELGANLKSLDERLHSITTEVGGVKEVTGQLREFQASLKSQKLRGNVGEMVLEDLLHQVLPVSSYAAQFTFKTGKRVDALIKTRQGNIPVDSKFPVENFQAYVSAQDETARASAWKTFSRDVKARMEETAQYILPDEGTVPFALMYIPYEPIFQEVVADGELTRYTFERKVFFTSPQTFLVTLQSVLLGLQREKFAEQAVEILRMLHSVSKDAAEFEVLLKRAATQLADSKTNMDKLLGSFSALSAKLDALKDIDSKEK